MVEFTFEELVAAVQKLPPEQQAALAYRLHQATSEHGETLTREQALAELEALRATGAFDQVESLLGKYAGADVSREDLDAAIHEAATEWEDEFDEFFRDGS
ncbi:MAG TPA: hypothetical protein VNK95_11740 [Caldilineaceae bacterium]|nr:hypothetical protein [Caldilineaceae bacterium]